MLLPSRRTFLGASLAGLASGRLPGADDPPAPPPPARDDPAFQPSTLFLTWQRDPTTTMTVQWVGTAGETADTKVYFAPAKDGPPPAPAAATAKEKAGDKSKAATKEKAWPGVATVAKPYPMTDFKVYRTE